MSAPVGFIGLGNIGAPMARHLLDWPGGLVVCDLREEVTAPFAADGATVASSPAEVAAAGATVISVMVVDDDQVRAVVADLLPVAAPGTVILIHSTITPATAEELAARAAEAGVAVADAPVSGGFMGATDGRLAVMVGATDEAFERCRPVCERFGELVLHLGPPGAGTRAKLARNLLTFASYAVAAEAQRLAEAAGVSLSKLARVVRHSDQLTGGPGAIMVRRETAPLAPDDPLFEIFSHSRDLGEKDLRLALALGEELGVDLPFATLALRTLADGLGVPHQP
jgi:3-hydroxyisobutyrate dehydrogenase-like beta-hydroxyacid dehydrogenase